jgi:hypothetical protein
MTVCPRCLAERHLPEMALLVARPPSPLASHYAAAAGIGIGVLELMLRERLELCAEHAAQQRPCEHAATLQNELTALHTKQAALVEAARGYLGNPSYQNFTILEDLLPPEGDAAAARRRRR